MLVTAPAVRLTFPPRPVLRAVEELANLIVGARREVVAPMSDAEAQFRRDQADELVHSTR